MLKKIVISAAAALALAATPALGQAVLAERAPAAIGENEKLAGGTLIIAVLAAAAVVAGIVIIADGDDDQPTSP